MNTESQVTMLSDIVVMLLQAAATDLRIRDLYCRRAGGLKVWDAACRVGEHRTHSLCMCDACGRDESGRLKLCARSS